jgi:hypothetical protein
MSMTPSKAPSRPWLGIVLFAIGVALFMWLVRDLELDRGDVQGAVGRVGWWFVAILGLTLVRFALRTAAWLALATPDVPFRSALAATIAGDALGNVLPLGVVASEPAKAMYLRRYAQPDAMFAPLAAENFFYSVSVAIYVIGATAAMLVDFPDIDPTVHLWGQIALGSMAAVLIGALWLATSKPAVLSALLARVPLKAARTLVERVRLLETNTYGAAGRGGNRLGLVALCEGGFHLLSLVECWLTFWLLTGVTAIVPALVYDGFNRVVNIIAKPVPAKIGVEEVGTAFLANAIGYTPMSGFLLAIVRKVRMLVFAGIGLALWARRNAKPAT